MTTVEDVRRAGAEIAIFGMKLLERAPDKYARDRSIFSILCGHYRCLVEAIQKEQRGTPIRLVPGNKVVEGKAKLCLSKVQKLIRRETEWNKGGVV
ncbi:MAG: hypothetical protein QF748_02220 [Candidatus Pacebacteria bacterium]|jgi:hypothetical protein|nr:hypothetical protein [Parcubacteria group bacterium]MDP6119745.1 hypothetical protein [Candidatus Paceibacterota bacterium]|tara:strand:+ start:94 stop:381 length:288 start_codon:yes stop_codon:yes gene_type:complete